MASKPRAIEVASTSMGLDDPSRVTVIDATTSYFDFPTAFSLAVGFFDVLYQDMQVQNFQGGFVVPGGKWFRPLVDL